MLEPHLGPHNSSVLHDATHHAFSRNALRSKCKIFRSDISYSAALAAQGIRLRVRTICAMCLQFLQFVTYRWRCARSFLVRDLAGYGATDDLNKIAGTYLPGKCGFHFVGVEFKVLLRCPYRFVQREANLCPSERSFGYRILTRLAQRDLS